MFNWNKDILKVVTFEQIIMKVDWIYFGRRSLYVWFQNSFTEEIVMEAHDWNSNFPVLMRMQ